MPSLLGRRLKPVSSIFFGDKFQMDTAQAVLDACKQGSLSVEEYNSQFSSIAYLVDLTDKDRLHRYTKGLNLNIQKRVENSSWRALKTLEERQQVAAEAARDIDIISRISESHSQPPKAKPTFQPHRCCFRCLKRTSPPDHTTPSNCPNGRTTLAEKERFVERYRLAPPVSIPVAACAPFPSPLSASAPPQDFDHSLYNPQTVNPQAPIVSPSPPVQSGAPVYGFDEVYDDVSEAHLATVEVSLDTSRTGRIVVPVSFQVSPSKSVVASVLVDTGAMANFINQKFIDDHQLPIRLRKTPIRCIGFDGNEGVGGTVTHDWAGQIHVSSANSPGRFLFQAPSVSPASGPSTPFLVFLGSTDKRGRPRAALPVATVSL
ncbi:hypothetical protein Pst134EA_015328 [Puccinia striiformis f. sp. tritici]|uniref:hypothetical protein n=1 Tax=Puccinia striiformis f. sp. tritici TaxID=168172 RepID=UPI0020075A2F|nr:hypothetical protein Pst134EA_015328 [Puccinia striiformis f. sp. tritici]KAH9463244.1 hypothetical protein Pst134EA_015328 [Puccinia striiformis f. sp. tritici]